MDRDEVGRGTALWRVMHPNQSDASAQPIEPTTSSWQEIFKKRTAKAFTIPRLPFTPLIG